MSVHKSGGQINRKEGLVLTATYVVVMPKDLGNLIALQIPF